MLIPTLVFHWVEYNLNVLGEVWWWEETSGCWTSWIGPRIPQVRTLSTMGAVSEFPRYTSRSRSTNQGGREKVDATSLDVYSFKNALVKIKVKMLDLIVIADCIWHIVLE